MSENPYKPSEASNYTPEKSHPENVSGTHAAYNIVSDTVTGLNLRKSDNKFQVLFIIRAVLLFAALGAIVTAFNGQWNLPWFGGAVIGAFGGLIVGVLASGTVLMLYRGKRHLDGKHD